MGTAAANLRLGAEWALLEAIAAADDEAMAIGLAGRDLDLDELVSQAMRHALLPALADFLLRNDLLAAFDPCVGVHLLSTLQWNRHRSRSLTDEAIRVVTALNETGITVACTKGVVCQVSLYDRRGTRFFSDVDFMIDPTCAGATAEVLRGLGYRNDQRFDLQRGQLVAVPREVRLAYRLYPDHLEPFFRVTDNTADPVYKLDFAFSLTWYRSQWQVPMTDVLAELDRVDVTPDGPATLPSLAVPYAFLFLVLHTFRDAWFHAAVVDKDVRLTQIADVVRFWRRLARSRAAATADLVRRHDLGPPVAWVGHHVDAMFGTTIVGDLGLEEYVDRRWLRSASAADGTYLEWDGDLRHRLWLRGTPRFRPAGEPPFGVSARHLPAEPTDA